MPRVSVGCTVVPESNVVWGDRPSMGITLLFATFGFGADRFYVGQVGGGIGLLIAYLTVFGILIAGPIEWLSALSLVFGILMNRQTAFMYGKNIVFAPPSTLDKILAVLWILFNAAVLIAIPVRMVI